jgi:hypothetical protein
MELKTKFIEGTNEQYSIREDGVVISHYRFLRNLKKEYRTFIFKGHKDKNCNTIQYCIKGKMYSKNALLITHFGFKKCYTCEAAVKNILHSYCKDCIRIRDLEATRNYRKNNPIKVKEQTKKTYLKNKDIVPKGYIASLLALPVNLVTDELYNHHRNLILYKREIAKKHNIHMSSLK